MDTSMWCSESFAPPTVQVPVSLPAMSKLTAPAESEIDPVNDGLIVRPATGVNDGVSVVVSTVSDQFLLSLIPPETSTVTAADPEPSTAVPARDRPELVLRVIVLPDLTVRTLAATTALLVSWPVSEADSLPPV